MASITGPFYHAMKVGFAFLGLLGVWWFYRAVVVALGKPYPKAFYLLAFFPSILFWSSILGKDPLQFCFLGLYAYGGSLWLVEGRLKGVWYAGFGAVGSYLFRPWLGITELVVLGLVTILGRCQPWQTGMALTAALLSVLLVNPVNVIQSFGLDDVDDPEKIRELVEAKAEGLAQAKGSGSKAAEMVRGQTSLPMAIFSGLFRPLPFDITNPFTALAAIENSIVLFLAVVALFRFRFAYLRDPIVLWPLLMSLFWALLYGFIVMANFGSGTRYKLQIWPFLLMLVVCLVHKEGRKLLDSRTPAQRPLNAKIATEARFSSP
jgi:hypothetical protein